MAATTIGSVIDSKYEVIRTIGRGGMSVVWLAQDKRLGKLWAVKEIKPNVSGSQGAANRQAIIDEANFMKRLDHPAIPRVVDILDMGDTIFVVMDYVNGTSLDRLLAEQGTPFEQEEVIDWGVQLCEVLDYLHSLRPPVVYRDMKPANVILRDDGSIKLIDFGVSLELTPGAAQSAKRIGSAGYSAPEQIDAEAHKKHPIDGRADVYALGATLYTLVTGHTPHRIGSGKDSTVEFDMRPIREINPQLSDGLEQILLRATQYEPEDRYPSIADMRRDLEHYEVLTGEWRAAQQRKVDTFWKWVRAAAIAFAVGLACMLASTLVRNSSYDTLMHQANTVSAQGLTEERNVQAASSNSARTADASEAEEYLTEAIRVAPTRIEPYRKLLEVYTSDDLFTPTEAERWMQLWNDYGRNLRDNEDYARLCYDTGITYLCYYDFLGVADESESTDEVKYQKSLENATRASMWFKNAYDVCDVETNQYFGLEVTNDLDEYSALKNYQIISDFNNKITRNSKEGKSNTEDYREFWDAINEAFVQGGVIDKSEPIVQLRLLQVAFESLSSANNLNGFAKAGIDQTMAIELLDRIEKRFEGLHDFIEDNPVATELIAQEISQGMKGARENIAQKYSSPVARLNAAAGSDDVELDAELSSSESSSEEEVGN